MSPLPGHLIGLLNTQAKAVLEVLFIYLALVAVAVGLLFIIEPISNLDELRHEFRGFVDHYKETPWWWLTTFFVSVIALTVGSGQSLFVDLLFLSLFTAPAIAYYHRNYPFSLQCEYRARTSDGRTAISEEKENIATLDQGKYVLEFPITTGSNIEEFSINLTIPDGVEVWSFSTIDGVTLSEGESTIQGESPPGRDSFVFELILDENGGVQQGANLLILSDSRSGRELTSVRLIP